MAKTMTEGEWLEGANPARMVCFLRQQKASQRKLRLFGCACCRRVWDLLPSEASRRAVAVAERFADGLARRKDLTEALQACGKEAAAGATHDPAAMVVRVSLKMAAWWASYNAQVQAAGTGPLEPSQFAAHTAAMYKEGLAQRKLLHDIFGNPFRPVRIDPAWLAWGGGTIPRLAQAIYDERSLPSGLLDIDRLCMLADALEEAGCGDADVLGHCRVPAEHVRGCWLIDLLTGKN
jgi:hypothetical protein